MSQTTSVGFSCCSWIASASAAAPHLHLLQLAAGPWLRQLVIVHKCSTVSTKVTSLV